MAVSIGTTGPTPLPAGTTIIPVADVDLETTQQEYGVGNFSTGMNVVFDTPEGQPSYDMVHQAVSFDENALAFEIVPALDVELPAGSTMYKVYEGAHGTEPIHLRKRLLGYI